MNINWYYSFITLAATLNYHKASKKIHLTEPTIYKQIKNLENLLGAELFYTDKKKLYLTREGKYFLPLAVSFVEQFENDLKKMKTLNDVQQKNIDVAVSPYIATYLISKFLSKFFVNHPNINVSIHVINENIEKSIYDEVFDIGISRELPTNETVLSEKVCEGKICLFAPKLSENYTLDEKELFQKYKIISENHPIYWKKLKKEVQKLVPNAQFVAIKDVSVTEKLITKNQGVSFLPNYLFALNSKKLLKVESKNITLPISHTYIFKKYKTKEIEFFENEFKKFIKEEQKLSDEY